MGFLGLLTATRANAVFNIDVAELGIGVEGTAPEATSGIELVRSGLEFRIQGWTGPLTGKTQSFSYGQTFPISMFPFPKSIMIVDSEHAGGIPIPVQVGGFVNPPIEWTDIPAAKIEANASISESAIPSQHTIQTIYDSVFEIKQRAEMPKEGRIQIDFDSSFLTLQKAGIDDNNIVWCFKAIQTGRTQIILTIEGGISTETRKIHYNVDVIFFPFGPGPVIPSHSQGGDVNGNPFHGGHGPAVLSFLGRVNIARNQVMKMYPEAQLYYVNATTKIPSGVTSSVFLTHLTVMFRIPTGTATIESTGYSSFGPIVSSDRAILGNANVEWPVPLDEIRAEELLRKAGYHEKISSLLLKKPLYPGMDQDYYVYSLEGGMAVWVGCKDEKVSF